MRPTERAHDDYIRNVVLLTFIFSHRRATELTVQSERAFQKQPHIFLNSKTKAKTARPGKNGRRWYKDVGLGFRTPKNAIEGNYIGMCDMSSPGFMASFSTTSDDSKTKANPDSDCDDGLWSCDENDSTRRF